MGQVRSLKGAGQLIIDGDEFDGVSYAIFVSIADGEKIQWGRVRASPAVLWKFSDAGGGVLRLEDGTEVDIVHLSTDVAESVAGISVNGPLPGF